MGWQEEELAKREENNKLCAIQEAELNKRNREVEKIWNRIIEKNAALHPALRLRVMEYANNKTTCIGESYHLEFKKTAQGFIIISDRHRVTLDDYSEVCIYFDPVEMKCVCKSEFTEYVLDDTALDRIIQNLCTGQMVSYRLPWLIKPDPPPPQKRKVYCHG